MSYKEQDKVEHKNHKALVSLSFLDVTLNEGVDYVELLSKLVEYSLPKKGDVITPTQLKGNITNIFGLCPPLHTLELCLRRLSKSGVVEKSNGCFSVIKQTTKEPSLEPSHKDIRIIIESLKQFLRHEHSRSWSDEKCEAALLAILNLNPNLFGYVLSDDASYKPISYEDDKELSENDFALLRVFFSKLYENKHLPNNEESLSSWSRVVKGYVIASAFLAPDLNEIKNNFKDVVFVFDTPFLISLFDFGDEVNNTKARELYVSLSNSGGRFSYFSITKTEVESLITTCLNNFNNPEFSSSIINTAMENHGKTWLEAKRMTLDTNFRSDYLREINNPHYQVSNHRYQVNENRLRQYITNKIRYRNKNSLEHDVQCIRNIYTLRKGRRSNSLENCKYIFVTTNRSLEGAVRRFDIEEEGNISDYVFPSITGYALTNLVWLKNPSMDTNLPLIDFMAAVEDAISPTQDVWTKFVNKVKELEEDKSNIPVGYHQAVRVNSNIKKELYLHCSMKGSFDEDSVRDIIKKANQDKVNEVELRASKEIEKYKADFDAEKAQYAIEIERKEKELRDKNKKEQQDLADFKKIANKINNNSRFFFRFLQALPIVVILCVVALPYLTSLIQDATLKLVLTCILLIIALPLAVYNGYYGKGLIVVLFSITQKHNNKQRKKYLPDRYRDLVPFDLVSYKE